VRTTFQLMVLVALVTPVGAQSLQVFGYAGVLGEWENPYRTMDFKYEADIIRALKAALAG